MRMLGCVFVFAMLLGACNGGYLAGGRMSPNYEPRSDVRVNIPGRQRPGEEMWAAPGHEQCFSERTLTGNPGTLVPRECVLRNIERTAYAYDDPNAMRYLQRYAAQIEGFYQVRSGRQQLLTDAGAAVTTFAGLGAATSGRVGAATQRAWLGVAFLPILTTSINANEPTRDLFYAGDLAIQMVNLRYQRLQSLTRTLDDYDNVEPLDCSRAGQALNDVTAWPAGDDRNLILPEAQRLHRDCLAVQADGLYARRFVQSARALRTHWVQDYAGDILLLDRKLVQKDRQFRYSPSEALSLLAAAPFRTLDTFISGQNTDEAIDALRTNAAFEGMDLELAEMHVPAPRAFAAAVSRLNDGARARRLATRTAAARPNAASVGDVLTRLDELSVVLAAEQDRLAYQHTLISEFHAAAAARYMLFDYQVSRGLVTVDLSAAPRPASPVTPASAQTPPTPAPAQ